MGGIGAGAGVGTLIWAFSKREKSREKSGEKREEKREEKTVGLGFGGQPLAQGCPKIGRAKISRDKGRRSFTPPL